MNYKNWIRNGEGQTDKNTLLFSKSPLKIQVAIKIFNCKRLKSIWTFLILTFKTRLYLSPKYWLTLQS